MQPSHSSADYGDGTFCSILLFITVFGSGFPLLSVNTQVERVENKNFLLQTCSANHRCTSKTPTSLVSFCSAFAFCVVMDVSDGW